MIGITEKDYNLAWSKNSKQHFDDGDYEWLCDLEILQHYNTVFEIGCEAGYSTLTFLLKDYLVLATDINPEAIKTTASVLKDQR